MHSVHVHGDRIKIGPRFTLSFQRTLRIPDDGGTYPLPPGLGRFPIRRVADYAARVPASWRKHGGVFLPMYQREAMWLLFDAPPWHPCALQVAVGKVNAISGERWSGRLGSGEAGSGQNYVVAPDQPWLDGIKAGEGFIRQFVAMPLGMGYTVEGQVTGREEFGGLQIKVFEAKPGRFPEQPPRRDFLEKGVLSSEVMCCCQASPGAEMGLAAGGRMRQLIYPDAYGIDTWDPEDTGRVYIHIVNCLMYREITGEEPPRTPVSAQSYAEAGLPWFDLYDEQKGDLPASRVLGGIKSVKEIDAEHGFAPQQDDGTVAIPKTHVIGAATVVSDGEW
jgi:hypothetical protein